MNTEVTKSKIISSLFWKFMERGGVQGIQFVVSIVLARILSPEEFGKLTLIAIFITISGVLVQGGFNTALIQKKDADEVDLYSVFYLNLVLSSILYFALFFTAPFLGLLFEDPQLIILLRVLSLSLFFGAFNSIQNVIVQRNMEFKKLFFSSLGAIMISGPVGIVMAYTGFGIWALIGQHLTNQLVITIILWMVVNWRPKLLFSLNKVKRLFSFGWKILVSGLIDTLYNNLRGLMIGKLFSPAMLGFYNRGEQFPSVIIININGSIQSVMLPALALNQDDRPKVKSMMRRSIVTSSFIIFPMMVGLAVIAEPLVKILLTEKWLPAVPFLQIFCASYALWPIHTANLQAINALGRSDIFLKLEIIKKIVGVIILIITIPFGVYALALGVLAGGIISSFINAYPNLKLLNYSFLEQWKDIIPSLIHSLIMGACVYSIQFFGVPLLLTVMLQITVGIIVYIGLAIIYKNECFTYLQLTGKEFLKEKKRVSKIRLGRM
ncbi:lipopolysaccharide biosynthesis protein [Neobacillus notoginsengisoli]|uniref:Lipopolysaccharide biosynthesis protein n=1 Tax=Neobacillus notoginsengisoli TaxID=1578198 RepID=A0A417YZ57_9BACI|nr:lipopolysaccharide biosynthesis protein [Neobacillus notoginsengisoli]RHW42797.1 lipopolysaccharide biosynthesis protein [Neobacillus notoginsengisoli]